MKRIQGITIVKQLGITVDKLLEWMKADRVTAYTIGGDRIYNLDVFELVTVDKNGKVQEDGSRGPSREAHLKAQRRFALYQLQKARIASGEVKPVSEFPAEWHGISFNPPNEDDERESYFQRLLTFLYEGEYIEKIDFGGTPEHDTVLGFSKRFTTPEKSNHVRKMADELIRLKDIHRGMTRSMLQENYKHWFKDSPSWNTFMRDFQELQRIGGMKYKNLLPKDRPGSKPKKLKTV